MRLVWLCLPLLVACSQSWGQRLSGRWYGESLVNVDTERLAQATAWARGTSFEFSGSNVTIAIPTEMPRSASYEVVKGDERSVTIAVLRPDGQRDMARMTLLKPDVIQWDIGEQRAVILRRM
ncbi:MAG TPA: hypothetical protein VHM70_15755 [Polyangiaceae bacterium]|jgi:hypothetical protein|nr:hypothetical protein [Polyangiaceae bacterium]